MSNCRRRILLVTFMCLCALPGVLLGRAAGEEPSISRTGSEPVLKLTSEQKAALKAHRPNFQIRKQSDYLPSLVKQYPFSDRQLPFAVIGDFDGDGLKDVVLQGHDKTSELLLAILSSGGVPGVIEISRSKLFDSEAEFYDMGDHQEHGLWTYLTFVPKGMVDSPFANRPLKLSTDAFQVNYFEKASVLYYWSGGGFMKYVTGD